MKLPSSPVSAVLRHVAVIIRHGDRSPSLNPFVDVDAARRSTTSWIARAASENEALNSRFPPWRLNPMEPLLDSVQWPWGSVTTLGLQQCYARGREVASHYNRLVSSVRMPSDVIVRSSSYTRTRLSAQAFLDGLALPDSAGVIPVRIGATSNCNIAPFDADIGLREASRTIFDGAAMAALERKAVNLACCAAEVAPCFVSSDGGRSSKFLWIRIAELFVARAVWRDPPLTRELCSAGPAVFSHLARRFALLFSDELALCLAAGGLLTDIADHAVTASSSSNGPKLSIVCGHDVTLLALVYSLMIESRGIRTLSQRRAAQLDVSLQSEAETGVVPWPSHAATLSLEVYGCGAPDGGACRVSEAANVARLHTSRVVWRYFTEHCTQGGLMGVIELPRLQKLAVRLLRRKLDYTGRKSH